jgi:putative redox protein
MPNTAVLELVNAASGLRFEARAGSGARTSLDSGPGRSEPSPVDSLLMALGGCEGMDVISILRKKRQQVTGYQVALTGHRVEEHPRRFKRIEVVHRVRGHDLSEPAVEEAVRLSHEKYCSVRHSLDPAIEVIHRWELIEDAPDAVPGNAHAAAPRTLTWTTPDSPPPATRRGFSELILRVADVDRALAFYRDVVGLALEKRDSPTWAWLWSGAPNASPRLGLTGRPLSFGAAHTGGPAHFAIAVARSAIPAEQARIQALGIEVEGPITFQFWQADSIYFSDPDGNRVELCGFAHLDVEEKAR